MKKSVLGAPVFYVLTGLVAVAFVIPIVWAVVSSVSPNPGTAQTHGYGFNNYIKLFSYGYGLPVYLRNSLIVSIVATVAALIVASTGGYAFARFKFKGKNALFLLVLSIMMLPYAAMLIPLLVWMKQLGLQDSLVGVALVLTLFQIPFAIFMMRNSFSSIPAELEEAAMIDGCNSFQAFYRIMLPAVRPGLVTVGLFVYLAAWNDFMVSLYLLSMQNAPLPLALVNMRQQTMGVIDYGLTTAGVVVLTVPAVILFVVLQKYYVRGFTSGAVKGSRNQVTATQSVAGTASPRARMAPAAPVVPIAGALAPVGLDEIHITGGFWGERQRLNANTIIPHIEYWEDRVGWLANFDAAASGTIAQTRTGREFSDSDVYKLLEAMAWEIGRTGDEQLQKRFDAIVARIGPVQQPDGYLSTRYGNPGQEPRYSDLEWGHELYCYGHLIQAAVARLRTGHHDALVEIALRAADHVCDVFGVDGIQSVCGHPEIEPALVELYRATGEKRYLTQARMFLDRRGTGTLPDIEFGRSYFQDDVPIRDATVLRGHAVRALYLTAGAIDAGVDEGDADFVDTLARQYTRTLQRRTYITGGMGSHHQDEAFGEDYELPPDRAYCEACAGVASVMVAWRLLLATGDLSYADTIERTLYNVVAASPSQTGDAFFYTNPLQRRVAAEQSTTDEVSPRAHAGMRAPWFDVSCCPPNLSRTFAQLATYVATQNAAGVQILQYMPSDIRMATQDGQDVHLTMATRYPNDGTVTIDVQAAPDSPWDLTLRIPAWADGATVEYDGRTVGAASPSHTLTGVAAGSRIVLHLPMEPRWTVADARVDAVRGTVAAQRGPLVLCAESVDMPGRADVERLRVDPTRPLRHTDAGTVVARGGFVDTAADSWPYRSVADGGQRTAADAEVDIPLIPYFSWGNRGPSTMRVWLPAVWRGDRHLGR